MADKIFIKQESEEIFPDLTDDNPEDFFTFSIIKEEKEEEEEEEKEAEELFEDNRNINIVEDNVIIKEEVDKIVEECVVEGSFQGYKENYKVI